MLLVGRELAHARLRELYFQVWRAPYGGPGLHEDTYIHMRMHMHMQKHIHIHKHMHIHRHIYTYKELGPRAYTLARPYWTRSLIGPAPTGAACNTNANTHTHNSYSYTYLRSPGLASARSGSLQRAWALTWTHLVSPGLTWNKCGLLGRS